MGRFAAVPIHNRRSLSQALLHASRTPIEAMARPPILIRALRVSLRMTQTELALRSRIPRAHLARIESGSIDPQLETLRRLLDSMFCDLLILPWPRKRPGDALAERRLEKPFQRRIWAD